LLPQTNTIDTLEGWFINTGEEPVFDGRTVDVIFFGDKEQHLRHDPDYWNWEINSGKNAMGIQYWRYSK
jgi:hypothetical protein